MWVSANEIRLHCYYSSIKLACLPWSLQRWWSNDCFLFSNRAASHLSLAYDSWFVLQLFAKADDVFLFSIYWFPRAAEGTGWLCYCVIIVNYQQECDLLVIRWYDRWFYFLWIMNWWINDQWVFPLFCWIIIEKMLLIWRCRPSPSFTAREQEMISQQQ